MTLFDAPGKKPFENTVGKGEIALIEQFFLVRLFSTRLDNFLPFLSNLKLSSANSFSLEESKICRLDIGLMTLRERSVLTLSQTNPGFYESAVKAF